MNELDILDALTDVDDKYVLEASEGIAGKTVLRKGTKRRTFAAWNSLPAMIAAGVALAVIVAGGIVAVKIMKGKEKGKEAEKITFAASKPFVQGEILTKPIDRDVLATLQISASILEMEDRVYGSQMTECTKVGAKLGTYKIRGTVETTVTEDGVEHLALVDLENDADVYEIPGVKTEYAVAVYYESLQKYVVFGGSIPDVSNVAELRESMPIDTYFELDKTFEIMIDGNAATFTDSSITMEKVVEILLKNANSPLYDMKDMPNDFFKDTPFFDAWAGREHHMWDSWISRYDGINDLPEGKDWAQKFCKEHPLGELLGTGKVHNKLLEPANASGETYYLYSGGYILGYGSSFGKCLYVGPEAAEEFAALFQVPTESTVPNK